MKIILVLDALKQIDNLGKTENYQNLYNRVNLKKWLREKFEFFSQCERDIADKYGKIREDGSIVFSGDKEESRKNSLLFLAEKRNLENVEIEPLEKFTVTIKDLCGEKLSAETVIALEPFIDFEFMQEQT